MLLLPITVVGNSLHLPRQISFVI